MEISLRAPADPAQTLLKMGMDELIEHLQKTLESDFGYEDDYVIEVALRENLQVGLQAIHRTATASSQHKQIL